MKLRKVRIGNIDGFYTWLFYIDLDVDQCVRKALDELIDQYGFFEDNRIETNIPENLIPDGYFLTSSKGGAYGILLMPDEEEDLEYILNNENTYWIFVTEYEPGTILAVP